METVTATNLRSDLYNTLKKVLRGFEIKIHTKDGNIILIDEKTFRKHGESRKIDLMQPKAKGELVNDLKDADEALRNYIRMPV